MGRESLFEALPEGHRWATGGGSAIGGCNGYHIAASTAAGTLCGRYGPETIRTPMGRYSSVCKMCLRLAGLTRG